MTVMKFCSCSHEFQDYTYGIGMRVYNVAGKDCKSARCTVCAKTISLGNDSVKGKNKQ